MNREIKFRAWTRTGEWDEDGENRQFEMIDGDSLCPMEFEPFKDLLKDIDDEYYVMQFTGLKDKNGKEIYEGDILHIEYFRMAVGENLGVYEAEAELAGVVEFDSLSLILQNIVGEKWQEYTGYDAGEGKCKFMYLGDVYEGGIDAEYQIEVIGNIYENPELLKR